MQLLDAWELGLLINPLKTKLLNLIDTSEARTVVKCSKRACAFDLSAPRGNS